MSSKLIKSRFLFVLICFLVPIVFSTTVLPDDRPVTNKDELEKLGNEVERWIEDHRPKLFYDMLADTSGPQRTLNENPDIELMYIDDNGYPVYYTTNNLNAARTISTQSAWSQFGLSGSGTWLGRLGIWDAGAVLTSHQEFGGMHVAQWDQPASIHYHATHVAGTMVANGVDANAKGMSYQGFLAAFDWDNDDLEMGASAAQGMNISNHSYGIITGWYRDSLGSDWYWYGNTAFSTTEDYGFGFYGTAARSWDQIAYNAPYYTIVKAVGNDRDEFGPVPGGGHYVRSGEDWVWSTVTRDPDGGTDGYDCIPKRGTAKNIITVGAIADIPAGYVQPSDVVMSSFSSWGPTDDGRIKPDIVANGIALYSTGVNSNSDYATLSGTSMSSPNVSGSMNLLVTKYEASHSGQTPLASTIKAIMIHTADEAGPAVGPDYMFGWGLMNTLSATILIHDNGVSPGHITESNLADGEMETYEFTSNGSPIRLTLAWSDPPGTSPPPSLNPTTPILVNDLDIRLEHISSASMYLPYVLNPSSPASAANTGDNARDNVEQIYVASPPPGDYRVTLAHKGTLASSQYYSLISNNRVTRASATWHVSVSGSDVSGDGSVGNEFRTIQHALDLAVDGDSVFVAPGSYNEHISLIKAVNLVGLDAESTIIDGAGVGSCFEIGSVNGATITGFTITNDDWPTVRLFSTVIGIDIFGNIFEGEYSGILMNGGTARITRNIFKEISASSTWGIDVREDANCIVHNNTFVNGFGAIAVVSGAVDLVDIDIQNNIIVGQSFAGILFGVQPTSHIIDYNNLFDNNSDYVSASAGPNDINADPLFVGGSPFDYNLQCGSPCIDAGNPAFPVDPDGTVTDMGVYFFDQASQPDADNDGFADACDNCPDSANSTQTDSDSDGVGDVCDNCPTVANSDQTDADNDGFGAACDCNDSDSTINPNTIWYGDSDGDGYGNPSVTLTQCTEPAGYVRDSSDCNDTDSTINPTTVWYEDVDSDGFGVSTSTMMSCTQPTGFVLDSTENCPTDFNPTQADADSDGIGDACCCIGIRGDVNSDGYDVNILDLTYLVDYIFRGGPPPGCPEEADVNLDGSLLPNVLDLTYLVDYIFRGGPAPDSCGSVFVTSSITTTKPKEISK